MRVNDPASGARRPELDALTTNRALAMPLLPTLATAVVIASLSLLCRTPSTPEPASEPAIVSPATPSDGDAFQRRAQGGETAVPMPATIAFGQLFPLTADSAAVRQAPSRVAANARRAPKRAEPVRSAANPPKAQPETAPLPFRDLADQGGPAMPEGALPFAPTAAAVVDSVRAFGGEAATLGGSVLGSLSVIR